MTNDANGMKGPSPPASDRTETSDPARTPETPKVGHVGETQGSVPARIGRYHIRRLIATGGMGAVYEATQDNPRRIVAVKVMKQGIASRSALRRFEYESQLLARLRHSGIAQIYEAGSHHTDTGVVPYFAMEYIPNAKPITQFAEDKKWGTRQRLELFAKVCDAVHHGHQKGIIHRDLKPSNILVDSSGQPKIIDFGVARSTDSDMAVTTLQTDVGQLIGTLQYMSPEQCDADPHDIDTRSDVYALGVVLYELLCGKPPYDLTKIAMHQATRIIREHHPARLSTLNRTLRGDVETIALKALEKERERRYQSADEFGRDIQRYLTGEAIVARRASILYQLRIFARKNRAVFASLAAVFVILSGATTVSTSLYLRAKAARLDAERARDDAETARATTETARSAEADQRRLAEENSEKARQGTLRAERTVAFLQNMLGSVDPVRAKGKEVTVRELLDEASKNVISELADEPQARFAIRDTIARTYVQLGQFDAAIPHIDSSRKYNAERFGADHRESIGYERWLADTEYQAGKTRESVARYRSCLDRARGTLGEDDVVIIDIMNSLGNALRALGEFVEAEALMRGALNTLERTRPDDERRLADCLGNFAYLRRVQGNPGEAIELFERQLVIRRRTLGNESPWTIRSIHELAVIYVEMGDLRRGEELAREAVERGKRILGFGHVDTRSALWVLGWSLHRQERFADAEAVQLELLEAKRGSLGEHSAEVCDSWNGLAELATAQKAMDRVRDYASQLASTARRAADPASGSAPDAYGCLARMLNFEPFEFAPVDDVSAILAGAESLLKVHPDESTRLRGNANMAAFALAKRGRPEEAIPIQQRMIELKHKLGEEDAGLANMIGSLGMSFLYSGRLEEAETSLRDSMQRLQRITGEDSSHVASARSNLGECLTKLGRFDEAKVELLRAHGDCARMLGSFQPTTVRAMKRLSELYDAWGKPDKAAAWRERMNPSAE